MRAVIILLGRQSPGASCNLPEDIGRAALERLLIWSCSGWGLPCPGCRQPGGALLPHRFTLTRRKMRRAVYFLWRFPPVTRCSRYEPSRPVESGLSSPPLPTERPRAHSRLGNVPAMVRER